MALSTTKVTLAIICLVGFVIRLGYGWWLGDSLTFPDEKRYWCQIVNLVQHNSLHCGDSYAHDMPLTALLSAAFIKITGLGVAGLRVLFALLSAATIYLIAKLTALLSDNKVAPVIAAGIAAFYPFFIFYSSFILSETVFIFILSWYFLAVLKGNNKSSGVMTGLAGGLGHLTRPTMWYFFPVVWVWQLAVQKIAVKKLLLIIVITITVISPWLIRNYMVLGAPLIATSSSGHVLWEGNNPWNHTGGVSKPEWGYLHNMPPDLGELEKDAWEKTQAIAYIKDNPAKFVYVGLQKLQRFWHLWPNAPKYNTPPYKIMSIMSFGMVLVGALLSVWLLRRKWRQTLLIWLFIAYYTLLHALTIGSIRYRLPLEPLLIALAAAAFTTLFDKAKRTLKRGAGGH